MGELVSSIFGGSNGGDMQAKANASAEQTQAKTLAQQLAVQKQAMAQQQAQYATNLSLEQPYINAGNAAENEYTGLLNIPGAQTTPATQTAMKDANGNPITPQGAAGSPAASALSPSQVGADQLAALSSTPGYQFTLDQGTKALERGAAGTTGVLSSAEGQALTRYGQGLAGTTYNSFMDRLSGLAGQGQTAATDGVAAGNANATNTAAINQNTTSALGTEGSNVSSLQNNTGAAQASAFNTNLGAQTSILNSVLSMPKIAGG